MTENQLVKLKGRLLNIQTQLNGASLLLSKNEPTINSMIQEANKIVSDALIKCDSIVTKEIEPEKPKKRRKREYYPQATVIIARNEPPTYNIRCRNYSEIRINDKVLERTCEVGMDMCYCSKKCAYATNNVCSLRG